MGQRFCSCCDCDCDCDYCNWTTVAIWAAVLAVVGAVLTVLILAFAIVKPPTATADDALLTRFSLSPSPNASTPQLQLLSYNATVTLSPSPNASTPQLQLLSYNATVTLSLRNPNMYYAISYGALAAAFSFNGTRFDEAGTVREFEQGARKTTSVRVTVGGVAKALPKLSAAGPAEFTKEKEAGQFQVEARLDGVLQYKGRSKKCPVVVVCPLKLQLIDPGVAATAFQRTKCTILRAKTSGC